MNCPKCGVENENNEVVCKSCGEPLVQNAPPAGTGAYQPQEGPQYQPYQQPYQPQQAPYTPPYGGYAQPPQGPRPEFHNTSAIVACIFGFLCGGYLGLIFAIIGLVKGSKVDMLWNTGDYQGAAYAATEGNKYVKIAWIINIVSVVLVIIGFIALMALGGLAAIAEVY